MDNRTVLEKADTTIATLQAGGGYLEPAQAQKFMRVLIKQSVVMKDATVTPMRSHKQKIDKIRFASRILRAGTEATALASGDRSAPNFTSTELDAKLFKAEVRLSDEALEDSIERGDLKQTIMEEMAKAISRDMEEVIVNGDTASGDAFLAQLDGVRKQATSNVVAHGVAPTDKSLWKSMLKALPSEYLARKSDMVFYTSVDSAIDYQDTVADRDTTLGDTALLRAGQGLNYSGVPIKDVPLMPENLGAGTNETEVLLTDPKNINVGIWRQIKVETDRIIQDGVLLIVATMRFDVKYAVEDAVVKATGVTVA